jgi:hypothetical protein
MAQGRLSPLWLVKIELMSASLEGSVRTRISSPA